MDRFIDGFAAEYDADLMLTLCGVAYQRDMTPSVSYGDAYFEKYRGYEDTEIGRAVNDARLALVARHYAGKLCDIGIGCGTFIKSRPDTVGYDINKRAVQWLEMHGLLGKLGKHIAYSMWDVLEHVPDPIDYLKLVPLHGFLFVSLPIFSDLYNIRASKHYRPGEHLYYFMHDGLLYWMNLHGFIPLEWNDDETRAGRDSIRSYAFKRNRIVT